MGTAGGRWSDRTPSRLVGTGWTVRIGMAVHDARMPRLCKDEREMIRGKNLLGKVLISRESRSVEGFSPYIAANSKTTPGRSNKGDPGPLAERRKGAVILDVAQWKSASHALRP
jgi:hypothetical protein